MGRTNPSALPPASLAEDVHVDPGPLSAADWTMTHRLAAVVRGLPHPSGVQGRHERVGVQLRKGQIEDHVMPGWLEGKYATVSASNVLTEGTKPAPGECAYHS